MKSCEFNTVAESTISWFITNKILDKYNNILDLNKFRNENSKWTNYAKDKYNVDKGTLFLEEENGKKAVPNYKAFKNIDLIKKVNTYYQLGVNYTLKVVNALNSDKVRNYTKSNEQGFYNDLQKQGVPKDQIELVKETLKGYNNLSSKEAATLLENAYKFNVEVKTAKGNVQNKSGLEEEFAELGYNNFNGIDESQNTQYYSNLTVPGGTNYTENEISTPDITPSIKGHAQFSTDNGVGWFRSDEIIDKQGTFADPELRDIFKENKEFIPSTKTRRILELQSDLFQKGRDKSDLISLDNDSLKSRALANMNQYGFNTEGDLNKGDVVLFKGEKYTIESSEYNYDGGWKYTIVDESGDNPEFNVPFEALTLPNLSNSNENTQKNKFLQLLNKDSNWVTFFIKSIIQTTARETVIEASALDIEEKILSLQKEGKLEIKPC